MAWGSVEYEPGAELARVTEPGTLYVAGHNWMISRALAGELIRGEIVSQYTLIDDLLATKLCEYFFSSKKLIHLWKTKRFRRFNYYILERLYLVHKLAFLKDVYRVPKNVASTIEEINALRNAMAHAFFPENLRVYQMKGPPAPRKPIIVRYKGLDIFTVAGCKSSKKTVSRFTSSWCRRLSAAKDREKSSRLPLFCKSTSLPSPQPRAAPGRELLPVDTTGQEG